MVDRNRQTFVDIHAKASDYRAAAHKVGRAPGQESDLDGRGAEFAQ
jgi:hypothetical protein